MQSEAHGTVQASPTRTLNIVREAAWTRSAARTLVFQKHGVHANKALVPARHAGAAFHIQKKNDSVTQPRVRRSRVYPAPVAPYTARQRVQVHRLSPERIPY